MRQHPDRIFYPKSKDMLCSSTVELSETTAHTGLRLSDSNGEFPSYESKGAAARKEACHTHENSTLSRLQD